MHDAQGRAAEGLKIGGCMVRKHVFVFAVVLFSTLSFLPSLGQSNDSLGDAARRIRADKNKAAKEASEAPRQAASGPPAWAAVDPPWMPEFIKSIGAEGTSDPQRYLTNVQMLLMIERFEVLDKAAADVRLRKSRFPGGGWKLRTLYLGIGKPIGGEKNSDETWARYFESMKRWTAQRPDSVTAHVALANAYLDYAWKARGHEYADKVSDEGGKLFEERTALALSTLMQVAEPRPNCPEWYHAMQLVALMQGWDRSKVEALLKEAVASEPLYHYFYREHANYLLPKWHGGEGDAEKFAQAAANRIGGKAGDSIYADVAASLMCNCLNESDFSKLSWPRVKSGFEALKEMYGWSRPRQNQLAYMAFKAGDAPFASQLLGEIGDDWDPEVWHTKKWFDQAKEWASMRPARSDEVAEAQAAVEANMQTAAGQKYDEVIAAEFPQKYADAMRTCVEAESSNLGNFDILLQVGTSGLVQRVLTSPLSPVGSCLTPKLDRGVFSPPPASLYWVKISMTLQP